MKKRILSILLVVCMVLTLLPSFTITAKAAGEGTGDPANGEFALDTSGFNEIRNADQLAYVAQQINNNIPNWRTANYKIINNIDLSRYPDWEPIGIGGKDVNWPEFKGTFDGGGFTISNLRQDRDGGDFGLFGSISNYEAAGVVRNITLSNVQITASSIMVNTAIGAIVGNNYGTVENCSVAGTISATSDGGYAYVGGIVGRVNNGTVRNCYSTANVSVKALKELASTDSNSSGGIAGQTLRSGVTTNCYFTGSVGFNLNSVKVGAIVGDNFGTVSNCYWISSSASVGVNQNVIFPGTASNISSFIDNTLASPVTIGGASYSSLLGALNARVSELASTNLKTWTSSGAYPVFSTLWVPPTYTATVTVQKNGGSWTDVSNDKVVLSTSDASSSVNQKTGAVSNGTISFERLEEAITYYVWARNHAGVYVKTGSVSSSNKNATVNYYDVTLTEGRGIADVSGGETYLSGETANISASLSKGYTWSKWSDNNTTMTNRSVVVSAKTDLTASATLTPATAPGLSVAGAELTYGYISGSVSVIATPASGHTITGYQWYSNAISSNLGGTLISGATSPSYTLSTGKVAGTTEYYYCVVTSKRTDSDQTTTATSGVATVTVGKAEGTGTVSIDSWTYGQTAKIPVPSSTTNGIGNVTYIYEGTGTTTYTESVVVPTNAGSYKVTAVFATTDLYKGCTAEKSFAIDPATLNKDLFDFTAPGSLAYDGTGKHATVTVKANGTYAAPTGSVTVCYELKTGEVTYGDRSTSAPVNAGTYRVSIDVAANGNYKTITNLTDSSWTFTIGKATITNCLVSQAGTLTYNGSAQTAAVSTACTTAGSETASYQYCSTQGGTYSDTIPALTEAGAYTVYYKVTAPSHNSESGSFTVIIGSLDLSKLAGAYITVNPNTVVYTGEAWQPSVTVKSGSSTIPTENYTVSYSNNTNTGDVTVTVTAKGPNCTNAKSVTKSITKAELWAELFTFSAASALTYDGTAKPSTVTANTSGTYAEPTGNITIYYELKTGDSTYGSRVTTVPTSAGTYRVSIDVTDGGNYQGITNLTAAGWSFSITKAPISFNVSNDNYTFDANPHIATVAQTTQQTPTIADDQFAVTYKLPADGSGTADKTDVGIYDVIVTLSDDNFCFVGESDPTVRSRKVGELKINKSVVAALWKNTSAVYSGTVKSPEFALIGLKTADEGLVSAQLSGSAINAGTYIVTAELTGTKAGNYSLTNPVGAFVIQKAPVIFTLAGDSVKYDGNSHSVAATAEPNVSNVITYRNAKGEIIAAPAAAGSYDVYAEITNGNYRHADGTDGSPRKIGVLTIYQNNAPATYTASFDANGGSGFTTALSAVQSGTVRILPVNNFSNTGKSFAGWQYSGKIYQPGESFAQPSANVTLKALWNDKAYAIGGTVQEGNPVSNASNVVVTLMLGSRQIGQTITDAEGKYNFLDVSPGVYNLVANKDGVTQTIMVILSDKNITDQDIVMPTGALNSVVEVKAGSPAIVIGNLDKAFTEQDEAEAQTQAVELKLTAETKALDTNDLPQQEIQKKSGNINLFLDMTLTKKIGNAEITLSNSPVLLSAVITLPAELQGKDSYTVYRYHGTEVQTLTTTQNAEGEKIEISKDKTTLTVYTKNFSVYAIKGTIYSGGGGSGGSVSGYKLSFEVNGGSSIAMLSGAPDATVDLSVYRPVREGYNFAGWYTDEKLTNSITSLKLTANTTVYAKWTEKGAMPFADVPVDSYYYDAVLWALDKRITSGANPVTFAPGGICTRAQAVTFLWRAMGSPESTRTNSPFADVKADAYYYKAVLWATEKSITKGTSDSTFSPNRTVTRSQTMTFLWRTAGNPTLDGPNHFADVKAGAYYADAVLWAIEESITSGTSAETFSPLEDCSRAQIVTFLYRYMGK